MKDCPTRILVVGASDSPSARLCFSVFEAVAKQTDATVALAYIDNGATIECLKDADVLVVVRGFSWAEERYAKLAERFGCMIVLFIDDHLLIWNPEPAFLAPIAIVARHGLKTIAEMASAVISGNSHLANLYSELGAHRTACCYAVLSAKNFLERNDAQGEEVKIVYPAFGDHAYLFDEYILPCLPDLSNRYGKRISLTIIGPRINHDFSQYEFETTCLPFMPFEEYDRYMRERKFDIGLAPLVPNEFTMCKYFNKYLEYTEKGIVGIYSNVLPYTLAIEDEVNGLLAENRKDDWLCALERLIENDAFRRKILRGAQDHARTLYSGDSVVPALLDDIPELVSYKAKRKSSCVIGTFSDEICYVLARNIRNGLYSIYKKIVE